ncbi:MAG: heme exporter protein CcmB [Ardenticatenaceae bacterium]|nr:heme exporter protein CcmB [Ardenticatenaceae bacterium]MCB9005557.1 heme exporter protein CcmB [Ardenticatenaceae bacterium]
MTPQHSDAAPTLQNAPFWTAVWAIVWKDLQIEKHTRQTVSIMIMFSIVTVIMFNFALEANLAAAREVATGLLWSTILLAGTLGLNRSLAIERENQTMEAVLMAPVERSAIYLGKVISITLFTLILEAVLIFIFIVFFDKPFWRPQVLLVLFLGTIGYIAAGVIVTSMTIQTRTREVLLPVLLLPLSLPLVLPAATAVSAYMFPTLPAWGEVQSAISLVAIYDLLMLAAGFLTYHYVVES